MPSLAEPHASGAARPNPVAAYFEFERHGTGFRRETLAGFATFLTMAYIIIVNPAILANAGLPKDAQVTATLLAAALGSAIMALWARRPFAIAPYMGENAFVAFVVVKGMGYPWQAALGAVFVTGILFALLTLCGVRGWLAEAIPRSLKASFAVGIGLFLAFIGLNETGLVVPGGAGVPVKLGDLSQPSALLAVAGLLVTMALTARRIPGALVLGILATTAASVALGITPWPERLASLPPSLAPLWLRLDLSAVLEPRFFPVILVTFIMAFLDTVGTLIGLSLRAELLDERGNLPEIERPLLADALANIAAPLLGTTTSGAYIESAVGMAEGGRTGFTALVVAGLFLLALFFAPLFTLVPPHAYGIALVMIGGFMLKPVTHLDFDDFTELAPAFLTIVLMVFTYNIGVGMTAGLIAWPLLKALTGRGREIPAGMWALALLSASFFVFGPKP